MKPVESSLDPACGDGSLPRSEKLHNNQSSAQMLKNIGIRCWAKSFSHEILNQLGTRASHSFCQGWGPQDTLVVPRPERLDYAMPVLRRSCRGPQLSLIVASGRLRSCATAFDSRTDTALADIPRARPMSAVLSPSRRRRRMARAVSSMLSSSSRTSTFRSTSVAVPPTMLAYPLGRSSMLIILVRRLRNPSASLRKMIRT